MKTYIKSTALFLALPALVFLCLGSLAQAFSIPPEGQAVVVDDDAGSNNRGGVFLVNLITGQRTLVSDFGDPDQGPLGGDPVGIALQGPNTAYVVDNDGVSNDGGLYRVDLRTGQRTLISDFGDPDQGPEGSDLCGLTLDGSSAYVVDDDVGTGNLGLLFHVSLNTGQRTIISDFGDPAQGPLGEELSGVALDGNGNALVTDEEAITVRGALFLVDLNSGQRTVISDFGDPAQGPLGQNPFGVILDPSGNALVTDEGGDGELFLVDLTPGPDFGDRTLISNFENPAQGPTGGFPQGLALETAGQALVVDSTGGSDDIGLLFRVDTTSGDRTIISDFGDPDQGPIGNDPRGVAFRSNITRSVPTLSEWGLIAMAGVLGIVGFMVIRRRKVTV